MKIVVYRGPDAAAIPSYAQLGENLAADDFRSADVRKIGDNLYRARLDRSNRLLFALYRHHGELPAAAVTPETKRDQNVTRLRHDQSQSGT